MSRWLPYILLAFLVGVWYWDHDRQIRAKALTEHSHDSVQTAIQALRDSIKARAGKDSAITKIVIRERLRVDTLIVKATVAETLFVAQLPDSLKAPFQALIALKDSVIGGQKLVMDQQAQQLALRAQTIGGLEVALAASQADALRWRALSHPSFIVRVMRAAPAVGVGVGLGVILAH